MLARSIMQLRSGLLWLWLSARFAESPAPVCALRYGVCASERLVRTS